MSAICRQQGHAQLAFLSKAVQPEPRQNVLQRVALASKRWACTIRPQKHSLLLAPHSFVTDGVALTFNQSGSGVRP